MEQEIWKDIPGYEGKYQVSNLGNVKSLNYSNTGKIKLLKPIINFGYILFNLSMNNKHKHYRAHRLVAITFIPNPENKPQVNHIDGNKQNNKISNLEWCTNQENVIHNFKVLGYKNKGNKNLLGKYGLKHHSTKIVYQYDLEGNFIKEREGTRDIKRKLNISQGHIADCCRGIRKKCHGFIWSYKLI